MLKLPHGGLYGLFGGSTAHTLGGTHFTSFASEEGANAPFSSRGDSSTTCELQGSITAMTSLQFCKSKRTAGKGEGT